MKSILKPTLLILIPSTLILTLSGSMIIRLSANTSMNFGALALLMLLVLSVQGAVISFVLNIKSREYAEELRLSNDKLQQANEIIEHSTIVILEWAIGPGIPSKYVSKNISIFGYTEDDFYSGKLDYWDFVYEEDKERTQNTVWNARKENINQYNHTYRVKCKDGSIRWVEEWTLLERNLSGDLISEKGVLRDITEQVEIAKKLEHSEARYRELFENASAAIYTFDLEGNFTSVNNACCRVTGYNRNELLSKKITDLLEPKMREKVRRMKLLNVLQNFMDKSLELEIVCKNGRTVILECRSGLIYKDEQPIEIQTVAQDVTYRKLAEEKIFHLSYHDKLTGLYNRAYFEEALKDLYERKEYPFSIIIGDMNGLKLANDAFGHKEGDKLLITMARIIEKACRKNDIISRLGGDEFAIILPKTTRQDANKFCERIKHLCESSDYAPLQPSIALGCAEKLSELQTLEEFSRAADEDMYKNKLHESKMINQSIISTLQAALEEKMFETKEHTERLKELALLLGSAAGLSENKLDELSLAAVMHDIGKIALPGDTLLKPDDLTAQDWEVIKKHSELGYHIILSSLKMASIAEFVLAHHEHWDGNGYPRNLKGEEIPIISRIINIADAFDVMQRSRPYRKAMNREEAVEELRRCAGTQFDPNLVDLFINKISK